MENIIVDINTTASNDDDYVSEDCPFSIKEVHNYLGLEDFDRDKTTLFYICRARLLDRIYWIWRYKSNNHICYVIGILMLDTLAESLVCGMSKQDTQSIESLIWDLYQSGV